MFLGTVAFVTVAVTLATQPLNSSVLRHVLAVVKVLSP
jgi:hypothetical protein